jgi:hypothetical protein
MKSRSFLMDKLSDSAAEFVLAISGVTIEERGGCYADGIIDRLVS